FRTLLRLPPLGDLEGPVLAELLLAQPAALDVVAEDGFLARGPDHAAHTGGAAAVDMNVRAVADPGDVGATLEPDPVVAAALAELRQAKFLLVHARLLAAG